MSEDTEAAVSTEEDSREFFRSAAWADFIRFAGGEPGMRQAFTADTGSPFIEENMEAFILWVTRHHWGMDEAPAAFRAKYPDTEEEP
jgi:hypothetical protein